MRSVFSLDERLKKFNFPDQIVAVHETTPVDIVFTLPETVYTSDDTSAVKIAVWDKAKQCWSSDPISGDEVEFKKSTREIKFKSSCFAPMALLQSRCTDYPYQNWWLRCVAPDVAILTIWTKRIQLNFEIGPLYIKLLSKDLNAIELNHLKEQEMSPGYLFQELSKSGIHMMPRDEDAQLAGIEKKDRMAEERAIIDVACSVRAFHYRRCKWNQGESAENPGVGTDCLVLRVRENLEYDESFAEDYEPDWRQVMWWNNKVSFVEGTKETDEKCNSRIAEGQLTHSILVQAIQPPCCSTTAQIRTGDYSDIEFIDTIKKTLRLTRLLAFS